MIKAIIFDADYTLYSIKKSRAVEAMLSFLEKETGIKKELLHDTWNRVIEDAKRNPDIECRKREYSIKVALYRLDVEPKLAERLSKEAAELFRKAIVRDLVFDVKNRNTMLGLKRNYKLAVASDEFEKFLKMKLDRVFIDHRRYFSFLVTPEKVCSMKPSPGYYEIALRKLRLGPDEVIMVGDSWERDLKIASEMGMKTVLVNERIIGSPTHWIKNLQEITKIL